ncbi:MAG: radical SAM protein, partial [Gemmatimonadetes bacterium]|nr:radical SAM protein [Gemmatimonadota bacterium]
MSRRNILLIEPGYRNKYPPLGLMKLAAYHGSQGRGDRVAFVKGEGPRVFDRAWDRVYVTTLFSFEWNRTASAIDFALRAANGQPERVFVGGIAASLMHEEYLKESRWAGVRFIKGLLSGPPAVSLQLSGGDGDFGAADLQGTPIEELVPDYSILDQAQYRYPVYDAYFGYASRGCVRRCKFCGVPKLEGAQRDMPPLSRLV